MPKLRLPDLHTIRELAKSEFLGIPAHSRLPGMTRALVLDEMLAIAYYRAITTVLNRLGALQPDWVGKECTVLEVPDSETTED